MEWGGGEWAACQSLCSESDASMSASSAWVQSLAVTPTVSLMPIWGSEQHLAEASSCQGSRHRDHWSKYHWLKPHALAAWEHAGRQQYQNRGHLAALSSRLLLWTPRRDMPPSEPAVKRSQGRGHGAAKTWGQWSVHWPLCKDHQTSEWNFRKDSSSANQVDITSKRMTILWLILLLYF